MAYIRVCTLFVLTLLQLCRAEISDSLSESWYSANVINDGFQPKPISEIFSTESPFSSTNPIIVLPKSTYTPDEITLLSTLAPPRKISTTSTSADFTQTSFSSSTPQPPTFQTGPPSSYQTVPPSSYQTTFSTFPTKPSTFQTSPPTFQTSPPTFQTSPPTFQTTPATFQTLPPTFQTTPSTIADFSSSPAPPISSQPFSIEPEIQRTTLSVPQPSLGGSPQTQSQQIRLELVPQGQLITGQNAPRMQASIPQQDPQSSTGGPLSNYFLIYQQAPQNIQGFPGPAQGGPQFTTAAPATTTPTPSTVIISPAPTLSPPSTRTVPPTSSTPFPSTVRVRTTPTPRTIDCQNGTNNNLLGALPPLRIRVVAPSGSITNLHINPTSKTTTTRRPTTTRTRRTNKPRKNTYDACIDGCKGRREPICAAPLSTTFLDPETLKGFPSVCHMACHNSYRKDPYEKVLDGRCGRLRTRIRTVDSNKLKRDELNKAQYFLDNSGKTIVEFTALN